MSPGTRHNAWSERLRQGVGTEVGVSVESHRPRNNARRTTGVTIPREPNRVVREVEDAIELRIGAAVEHGDEIARGIGILIEEHVLVVARSRGAERYIRCAGQVDRLEGIRKNPGHTRVEVEHDLRIPNNIEPSTPTRVGVAYVRRSWGTDGAIAVSQFSDDEVRFSPGDVVYIDGGRKARVVESHRAGSATVVQLDVVRNTRAADALRGTIIEMEGDDIPDAPEGAFYHYEIVRT